MRTLSYTVRFTTPAFLGNAEQNGQWRTPPFKALLRQWWRVLYAAEQQFTVNVDQMRLAEGRLFGMAADGNGRSCKSAVRLRLEEWRTGKLTNWPSNESKITHPEVKNKRTGKLMPVGSNLYLGYGPLIFGAGNTRLKANAAIQTGEKNTLMLTAPTELSNHYLNDILQLVQWFGAIGSRSRNGWGSLHLEDMEAMPKLTTLMPGNSLLDRLTRPLQDCLRCDWPHAIGLDGTGRPLIWMTEQHPDWNSAMRKLAEIKIAYRTELKFEPDRAAANLVDLRHILAYPVTNHFVKAWGRQARLANQLRFKVCNYDSNRFVGVIYHLPCAIPGNLLKDLQQDREWFRSKQLAVWQRIHKVLDAMTNKGLNRI